MHRKIARGISATLIAWLGSEGALASGGQEEVTKIEDAAGNPVYASDAAGQEVTFVYDEQGQLIATIDQDGIVTDWLELFAEAGGSEQ